MAATHELKNQRIIPLDPDTLVIDGEDNEADHSSPFFDPDRVKVEPDPALIQSMLTIGWFGSIVGQLVPADENRVHVVAGRRRVRAARAANEILRSKGQEPILVTVTLRRGDGADLIVAAENSHRLEPSGLEKAEKAQLLLSRGRTLDQICAAFGWEEPTLNNWLAVLEARPSIRKALGKDRISASAAFALAKLPVAEQDTAVEALLETSTGAHGSGVVARDIARQSRERKAGGEASSRPKAACIKWLLKYHKEFVISDDAINMLRFLTGQGKPERVAGLKAMLTKFEAERSKKLEKKKARAEKKREKGASHAEQQPEQSEIDNSETRAEPAGDQS